MSCLPLVSPDPVRDLYRDHHGWLLSFLRRKLNGDRENAADLAHDTFERVLRQDIRPILLAPRPHLTTIAKSLAIDQFRRSALERAYLDALARQPEPAAPSPEQLALVLEALDTLCAMIDGLPQRARAAFLMAQLDGMPYEQIARELRVSVNVVQKDMIKTWQRCYQAMYA